MVMSECRYHQLFFCIIHVFCLVLVSSTAQAYAKVLGVVILSVRLSVTRMDCDKSKWCTADILISHERAITLLLLTPTMVGERRSIPSEICAQSDPPPFEKCRL